MAISIKGGATSNLAAVDANLNLAINPPMNVSLSGFLVAAGEVTDGVAGAAILRRPTDISPDYRLRAGSDQTLWFDVFNHGQFNNGKYVGVDATMTKSLAGGFLNINSGADVTTAHVTRVQTWRTFCVPESGALYFDMHLAFAQLPIANTVCEFGLGFASGVTAPTDGNFFRLNASGVLQGIVNNNGTETAVTLTGFTYSQNVVYHFLMVVHIDRVEFWINDRMYGAISMVGQATLTSMSLNLPLLIRLYNTATNATAQQMKIASWGITQADIVTNRLWATTQAGQGLSAINNPDGVASGYTANAANSAAPATGTPSNTAAGYTTLGGQWQIAAPTGAETDLIMFGYQVPAGAAGAPGKNLIVRGIHIETFNTVVAVATTPTIFQWGLAVGGSGLSLGVVADNAATGVRQHRRVVLGSQYLPIGAVVGQQANSLDINLDAPIICEAGTYFCVTLKVPVGTNTSTEIFRGVCFVNGYFE